MNFSAMQTRSRRRGMTLVEVMIASVVAFFASLAMISIFMMAGRFIRENFTETRILAKASIAVENMSRTLNHAYRTDAIVADNRPVISPDNRIIAFTVPLENGADERRRFRFDENNGRLLHERETVAGGFTAVADKPLLTEVEDFFIENQEGILSLVVKMRVDMGSRIGVKRYTMVGRALPRNL